MLRCAGRMRTLQGAHVSGTLDVEGQVLSDFWWLGGGFVVQLTFCVSVSLFLVQSHLTSCWCGVACSSPASGCFFPLKKKNNNKVLLEPKSYLGLFHCCDLSFELQASPTGNISTIFPLFSCRLWYFTSSGAIAWRRRFSEMPSRWTPRPMRCGTAWERCCRLKAMMMPQRNASWRRWSLKLAVPWSLLPSFLESFERASWSTDFGLTSGCRNPGVSGHLVTG